MFTSYQDFFLYSNMFTSYQDFFLYSNMFTSYQDFFLYSNMFTSYQDCISVLCFCFVCFRPVSCVPNGACFSGLSILDCPTSSCIQTCLLVTKISSCIQTCLLVTNIKMYNPETLASNVTEIRKGNQE
jgi:hypothetical protein